MSAHAPAIALHALTPALDVLDLANTTVAGLPLRGITIDHHHGNVLLTSRGPVHPRVQSWATGFGIDWDITGDTDAPPTAAPAHWHAVQVVRALATTYRQLPAVIVLINSGPNPCGGDVHIEVRDNSDVLTWAQTLGGYHVTDHEYRVDTAINGTPLSVSALLDDTPPHPAQLR